MKKTIFGLGAFALMLMMGYPSYDYSSYYPQQATASGGWYLAGSQGADVPPGSLFSGSPGGYGSSSYGSSPYGYQQNYPSYQQYGYSQPMNYGSYGQSLPYLGYQIQPSYQYGYQQQGYSSYGSGNSWYY